MDQLIKKAERLTLGAVRAVLARRTQTGARGWVAGGADAAAAAVTTLRAPVTLGARTGAEGAVPACRMEGGEGHKREA